MKLDSIELESCWAFSLAIVITLYLFKVLICFSSLLFGAWCTDFHLLLFHVGPCRPYIYDESPPSTYELKLEVAGAGCHVLYTLFIFILPSVLLFYVS